MTLITRLDDERLVNADSEAMNVLRDSLRAALVERGNYSREMMIEERLKNAARARIAELGKEIDQLEDLRQRAYFDLGERTRQLVLTEAKLAAALQRTEKEAKRLCEEALQVCGALGEFYGKGQGTAVEKIRFMREDHAQQVANLEEYVLKGVAFRNELQAELTRLRSLSTRWYLADGTYNTMPEEEVIRRRIEAAGVVKKAGDVEGMAKVLCYESMFVWMTDAKPTLEEYWESRTAREKDDWIEDARAVSAYLLGKE